MRWKAGGRRDTGHDCVLVEEGNRSDVTIEYFVLLRGLYYEMNASVFGIGGKGS